MQRLDKILASCGWGTRKRVKQWIRKRKVKVDGKVITDPGLKVDPHQAKIEVDGQVLQYQEYIYLMMNKPVGVLSATKDTRQRVVLDLLKPEHAHYPLFPVGRLDKDTTGLLLLTSDGQLAHQLLSPKKHVPKTYIAVINQEVTEADIQDFAQGIVLDDGYRTLPAHLRVLFPGRQPKVEITLYEGKYHQIKRMFQALGKHVISLHRIKMGNLALDETLKPGEYRELTSQEVGILTDVLKESLAKTDTD